ncbi:MFS transporter [Sphingomonas alpina]|uniref:MFS transporter n=1 Tax=Sphingomonas alpina TaxID=653931 RepID=A0A7H0LGA3_9SPHN|nr:MFS transporter [Sphingomonas alpina]QNQ08706.1 MFS transporter [Sphingomonas alpina]
MLGRWPTIITLWLIGVLAAAQLAKFSVIAPLLREQFNLSLPATGLLISLLEVGGGLFGFVAGLGLGRIGCRRSLLAGMAILALTSLLEALVTSAGALFAVRAVEGIGYLLAVIAAPTAIAGIADDRSRPRALALWSSFVPVGIAIGSAITSVAVTPLGLRGIMLLWAVLLAAAIVPVLRLPIRGGDSQRIALPAPAAWISTLAFGVYTLFLCALTMLLPTFLIEQRSATLSVAGMIAAVASLSALPASGLAILAMREGKLSSRRLLMVAVPSLVAAALLVPIALGSQGTGLTATATIIVVAILLSGLVSPLMFARLPILAGAQSPHDPRIATANGLLTQFGAGGALIGPPLGGLVVGLWGWAGLGIAVALLTLLMLAAVAAAEGVGSTRRT